MSAPVPQRDEAWLKAATPEQIVAANKAGELATLQGQPVPVKLATAEAR